jgi:hypothetical protein
MNSRRIAPELFDFVDEAAAALDASTLYEPVSSSSGVLEFCRNFYAQFFVNVLEVDVAALTLESAREANVLLKKHRDWKPEARALVRRFQRLCKIYPDIRGGDYGGGSTVYHEFHEDFIPGLLHEVAAWASAEGEDEVAARAASSRERYRAALTEAEREPPG